MIESRIIYRRKVFHNIYGSLVIQDNVFLAYYDFRKGKRNKRDVLEFEQDMEKNLFDLCWDLKNCRYKHGRYDEFVISDPKPRKINKALVRDRIVHHLVAKKLEEIYDPILVYDVYSSRKGKGIYKAIGRLKKYINITRRYSKNNFRVVKCDIKKFFASVDRYILIEILERKIEDEKFLKLLKGIIFSFEKGIPLGNLTSQIFANIYLNEFDQFVKHKLKIKRYLRYCDDFLFFTERGKLNELIELMREYLWEKLKLRLHPDKIRVRKIDQGIDWLGYVVFPKYIKLRTSTKRRILESMAKSLEMPVVISYFGLLKHCESYKIRREMCRMLFVNGW